MWEGKPVRLRRRGPGKTIREVTKDKIAEFVLQRPRITFLPGTHVEGFAPEPDDLEAWLTLDFPAGPPVEGLSQKENKPE